MRYLQASYAGTRRYLISVVWFGFFRTFGDTGWLTRFREQSAQLWWLLRDTSMGQRTLVPDAGEVVLHELKAIGRDRLVMVLRSAGARSRCPVCGRQSGRVHSRYSRHLSDLPWEGIPVRIELHVRRFFAGRRNAASASSPSDCRTRFIVMAAGPVACRRR